MAGRVMIVDAIAPNRIVLRSLLSSAQHTVVQATTGEEALTLARQLPPDVIISAVDLPDMTAQALFSKLRGSAQFGAIPILAVTIDTLSARISAFEAGADDVISRPLDQALLLARVRGLLRLARPDNAVPLPRLPKGLAEPGAAFVRRPRIALLSDDAGQARELAEPLCALVPGDYATATPAEFLRGALSGPPHSAVVLIPGDGTDGSALALLAELVTPRIRGQEPLVMLAPPRPDTGLAASALDIGAGDALCHGLQVEELAHRLRRLIALGPRSARQGQTTDLDPDTGLLCRQAGLSRLTELARRPVPDQGPFAVLLLRLAGVDVVLQRYGFACADTALATVAVRLRAGLRPGDLLSRFGDQSFLAVLPKTGSAETRRTALRLCHIVGEQPFACPGRQSSASLSLGAGVALSHTVAALPAEARADALLRLADAALAEVAFRDADPVRFSRPAA
ncbi:diguanylate cyclase [Mesobacterium sp. TK19101]|uniref:Diguanylate cyclase n=1 Tax=Mesobacterium hydrothermale TaxID=3111907 RepID=A0ABU6HHR5_9RHOB|nr:diguanylate cyclase [Mesobacterium sp. TK19101]MEC3861881.1 diguanylate cyclase [Mesobacterium sp. TK19101]